MFSGPERLEFLKGHSPRSPKPALVVVKSDSFAICTCVLNSRCFSVPGRKKGFYK